MLGLLLPRFIGKAHTWMAHHAAADVCLIAGMRRAMTLMSPSVG